MLNDEQILLKTVKLLEALGVDAEKPPNLYEFSGKMLREVNEAELEVMQDVLDDLKGEDLAFNKLFDGEMRKVIDFPTMDTESELGKFGEFFKNQDYDVDWEKGMVSAERDVRSTEDVVNTLMGGPERKKTKKIQLKIGKLFAKLADLSMKQAEIVKNDSEFQKNEDYKRIRNQISLYIPNPGVAGPAGYTLGDVARKYAAYWQTNAGYIKKEINKLDNEKYSIIITRHPIDVMRMSDFDKITSCHSPSSRGGGHPEYYKCAVAEAQGHGAIAYVVDTDDLFHATNTSNIESAEQEIQEGEIFADDIRDEDVGDITPVSRTRLRQFRYYDTDTPKRWDDGTEVGVPEARVYGAGIPGFVDRVVAWAKENQQEVIEKMPTDADGNFDLSRFMIFGGSYEDTKGAEGREELMVQLTGWPESLFVGAVRQNTETEDTIDVNSLGDMEGQWNQEIEVITAEWNRHYAVANVTAEVLEDHGGGYYIHANAHMTFKWKLSEFTKLPNSSPTAGYAFDSLNDIWGDIFDTDSAFINKVGDSVILECSIDLEHPDMGGEGGVVYEPSALDELCTKIDALDDKRDGFEAGLVEFLKREGWMDGGAYLNLAMEIEDGQLSSYEWDVETDGDYSDSYESYASISFDYDPEQWKTDPQVLLKILKSREYKTLLRSNLLAAPRAEVETEYYLDVAYTSATESGSDIQYTIQFKINSDDSDERVALFRDLVEGDMDDEDKLREIFEKTFLQVKGAAMSADPIGDISEQLVGNWRRFLS